MPYTNLVFRTRHDALPRVISAFVVLALLTMGGLLPQPAVQAQATDEPPNVLFISIDDWNDWLGVLGTHPQVKTPNIDHLAERGTLFTNAHVQAPVCNPSRVSLMTGLRPSTTGIYGLAPGHREVDATRDVATLPQHFAAHGYHTLSAGKIFHGAHADDEFEQWGPQGGEMIPEDKLVEAPVHMGNHPLLDWGTLPAAADTAHQDYKVATWAVQQLERFGRGDLDKPFFLAAGLVAPHVPLYASQEWFDRYPEEDEIVLPPAPRGDRADVPDFAWYLHWYLPEPRLSWVMENDEWRTKVRAYLATISYMDAQVGRILDALEAQHLDENTIVVLWSDHGYHLGEKGITGKNTLWERTTRVPLIFAGPGVAQGARTSRPAELLDLYPTLIDLAGIPKKPGLEGLSLLPQLMDADAPRERPAITTANPGNHSIRSERWRYIRYANGAEELYDHARDPHEWSNLAGDSSYADVIEQHARWIPAESAPHAPGSRHRILVKRDGRWLWEGEPIVFDELIR